MIMTRKDNGTGGIEIPYGFFFFSTKDDHRPNGRQIFLGNCSGLCVGFRLFLRRRRYQLSEH